MRSSESRRGNGRISVACALAALAIVRAGRDIAAAQDSVVGSASLPRDLTPWGMYLNADPVVKAVLIGLALASVATWTVCLAKSIEIWLAKRDVAAALRRLADAASA